MDRFLIDANGLEIEFRYEDNQEGETLLFLPGSYANTSAWKGVCKFLKRPYRMVFTSLRGYGNTMESRSIDDFKIDHQLEIIRTITKKISSPFHIVGHSMGGLVAFAAVFSGEFPIKSIISFEANPPWILDKSKYNTTLTDTINMAKNFEIAINKNDNDAAKIVIDFYGGEGTFSSFPEKVQEFCRRTAHVNLLDWLPIIRLMPPVFNKNFFKKSLMEMPIKLVLGENANTLVKDVNYELGMMFKKQTTLRIKGAGHFLISTHPRECADAIDQFIFP